MREWLHLMVSGDVIDYVQTDKTFFIAEHKLDGPRGVSYDLYADFHDWRDTYNGVIIVDQNIDGVVDSVDGLRQKLGQYTCTC